MHDLQEVRNYILIEKWRNSSRIQKVTIIDVANELGLSCLTINYFLSFGRIGIEIQAIDEAFYVSRVKLKGAAKTLGTIFVRSIIFIREANHSENLITVVLTG